MKTIFSALFILFSFNALATNCGLSFWNSEIEKLNDSLANGQIDQDAFATKTKKSIE